MSLDIGTLVAKVKVDDGDFDRKADGWSQKGAGVASAFGNLAADAIGTAAQALSDYVGDAMTASDQTAKFQKTLEFAGLDTSKIDELRKSTQAYADETVYNLGDIQSITATLAANGVEGYDTLAQSLGNLNAVAGGNAETFGRVGSVLTQTAGQGKLTTENWNQLTDAIPGASGKLMEALKSSEAYTGNFREAMEKGEITAEEFNAAIQQVGTDPVAVEAAKSVETFEGSTGNLAAAIQSQLVTALDAIKPALTGFQNGLAWFVSNTPVLIPTLAGLGAVLLAALAPAIWAAVTATWAFTVALLANPITWIVIGIGLLVAAIVALAMNWDVVVAWISDVWGGFVGWLTDICESLADWWNDLWAGFGSWITEVWEGFIGWVTDTFNLFMLGLRIIGDSIASWWNGLWAGIGAWVQSVWEGFVGWVTGIARGWVGFLMGAFNGFVSFWSGLWEGVQSTVVGIWEGIVGFFEGIPGTILGFFEGAGQWLYDVGSTIIQGLIDGINSMIGAVGDAVGGVLDWAASFFPHSPAERGPLSGSGWYAIGAAGEAIVDEFAKGLQNDAAIEMELTKMLATPSLTLQHSGADKQQAAAAKVIHYHAAENQSLTSEEALYAALGSPRVKE